MKNTQVFVGIFLLMAVLVFALAGCGSSGSSDSAWWGGGDSGGGGTPVTTPQVQTLTNLNNPGQPIRQGDWTQINGTGFGATQGAGYVKYTLENGSTGNADMYGSWSDTQITCRVPVTIPMDIAVKGTWGAQVFNDNGGSSNDFPTSGNPTPNPTPTNSPPSPSPSPTPSVSPSASPTPSVSPTPSPSPTSGGGGGGTPATAQWWNLGFAETANSTSNIQVGADQAGNVYVSYEDGESINVYEGESGAKGFKNINRNMTLVGRFPNHGQYGWHSLYVPQDTSKTYGIVYRNSTSLVIHKASVSSGTSTFKNVTTVDAPEDAGINSPSLYMSDNNAYVSYGFSYGGNHYVGVNYFPIPTSTSTPDTYTNWVTQYSAPNQGSIPGRNCTISKGTSTALNIGYLQPDPTPTPTPTGGGYYSVGSYVIQPTCSPSPAPSWAPYSADIPVLDNNVRVTNNGTSPYFLAPSCAESWCGLNLFGIATTGSSAGYFVAVGTPYLDASQEAYGTPIVANGKKFVTYSSGDTLNVMQNSSSTGPWTNIKTFTANNNQFGVGTTVNGAPLISYLEYNSSYGCYGIRTQAYTSTTPKAIAQREFIRATFLCCYAGVKFPLPRL